MNLQSQPSENPGFFFQKTLFSRSQKWEFSKSFILACVRPLGPPERTLRPTIVKFSGNHKPHFCLFYICSCENEFYVNHDFLIDTLDKRENS